MAIDRALSPAEIESPQQVEQRQKRVSTLSVNLSLVENLDGVPIAKSVVAASASAGSTAAAPISALVKVAAQPTLNCYNYADIDFSSIDDILQQGGLCAPVSVQAPAP